MNKPPYRVPSMKEIEQIPWNGLKVVSTFSGAGGSCLGYRMAGYRVLYANEFIPAAQETYKANHPHSYLDPRDIREVQPEEILDIIGIQKGELDLFDGSPPCASFSMASTKRTQGWGQVKKYSDTHQRVDDLFFEYIRILRGLQPKVFIAENVTGLVRGKATGFFNEIMRELRASGYRVKAAIIQASRCGVPQRRERVIFQGVREDIGKYPVFPAPLPYEYTVKEVLPHIVRIQNQKRWVSSDRPAFTIVQSDGKRKDHHHAFTSFKVQELKNEELIARKWTIDELKVICSFPHDFILTGTPQQQWERLGRAVPPLMMRAIASTVAKEVFGVGQNPPPLHQ